MNVKVPFCAFDTGESYGRNKVWIPESDICITPRNSSFRRALAGRLDYLPVNFQEDRFTVFREIQLQTFIGENLSGTVTYANQNC